MLEIIFVITVGKYFYSLADKYKKSKWGYAILGLVVCYGIFFTVALVYALIYHFFNPLALDDDLNDWTLTIISIPFALGGTYLLYYLLERSWKKNALKDKVSIDDIGKEI